MHCPKCGQQQFSEDSRFCSRCGFLLTAIAPILQNNGEMPGMVRVDGGESPKKRGIKKGAFVFLLSFLVIPLTAMISIWLNIEPFLVAAAFFLFTVGGLLRIVYAAMFESNVVGVPSLEANLMETSRGFMGRRPAAKELKEGDRVPAEVYTSPGTGKWNDTNELVATPGSVTDPTTKLLHRDNKDQ